MSDTSTRQRFQLLCRLRMAFRSRRRLPRRLALVVVGAPVVVGILLAGSIGWVRQASAGYLYPADRVPQRPVALVLGSQVYADGTPSPVLADRLATGLRLYQDGKVKAVLVSGDNGELRYNEVDPMRQWLITRGVPEGKVIGDYAGFDTYSSCSRATRIFGVDGAIVVTQRYHLPRAVALCRRVGIDAVGAEAGSSGVDRATLRRLAMRDDLAAVKAAYEMLVQPDPKYLGRHETGVEDALAEP